MKSNTEETIQLIDAILPPNFEYSVNRWRDKQGILRCTARIYPPERISLYQNTDNPEQAFEYILNYVKTLHNEA